MLSFLFNEYSNRDGYTQTLGSYLQSGLLSMIDLTEHQPHTSNFPEYNDADSGMNEESDQDVNIYLETEEEDSYTDDFSYRDGMADIDRESEYYEYYLALDENVIKKGLSEAELNKFPAYNYSLANQMSKPDNCCVICLSSLKAGDIFRKLACDHEYHKDCIDKWLSSSVKCPSCNRCLL